MTNYIIYPEQGIINISNAIKEKKGISTTNKKYTINEMPDAIRSINDSSGSGTVDEKVHTMNFDIFNDAPDINDLTDNEYLQGYYENNIFISKQHLREIFEYYSAGYKVEIITPPPSYSYLDYMAAYTGVGESEVTFNEQPLKFIVNNIFDILYDGWVQSDYDRYSGAAAAISCFYPVYENYHDNVDTAPHALYSHWITYILRDVTTREEGYYYN